MPHQWTLGYGKFINGLYADTRSSGRIRIPKQTIGHVIGGLEMSVTPTGYSSKFVPHTINTTLHCIHVNLKCIYGWIELESKQNITTEVMVKEIKSSVDSCNILIKFVESFLGKFEHDCYLSADVLLQYKRTISKMKASIVEITKRVLGE